MPFQSPKASAPERAAGQEGACLRAQRAGKRLGPQAREGRMLFNYYFLGKLINKNYPKLYSFLLFLEVKFHLGEGLHAENCWRVHTPSIPRMTPMW
jgi:hypothetical protein